MNSLLMVLASTEQAQLCKQKRILSYLLALWHPTCSGLAK